MKKIVLASKSSRRQEILKSANIDFTVIVSNANEIEETTYLESNIRKNSLIKASAIKNKTENTLIIGADTVVVLNSVCLIKPRNFIEAFFMLKKLSDKTHTVVTSHTILDSNIFSIYY